MILIGQYDSPFVRRVGIALTIYGISFEHRPWSAFSDADQLRAYNPLTRVPALVLDNGETLIDSHIILDYLDSLVPPERAMFPRAEPTRRQALKIAALAAGLADKGVSLFYEQRLHSEASEAWVARCRAQMSGAFQALEKDRAGRRSEYWFGDTIGHADIVVATALRFIGDVHPGLMPLADYPALKAHAERMEALPVFQLISQPFIPPT